MFTNNNYDKSISKKYRQVMKQLKGIYGHPLCGNSCKFKTKVSFWHPIHLVRQANASCCLCDNALSEHSHIVCHFHADDKYPSEFEYHHRTCSGK